MRKVASQQAICTALIAIGITTLTTYAQTPAPKTNRWETTAAAGMTLTSGNSDTVLATVSLDSKYKEGSDETLLGASAGYGSNQGEKSADFAKAFGQYNHLITERTYFGLRIDANHDGLADLAYRVSITPLLGYYLVKNDKTSLSVDVGPSLIIERYEGPNTTTDTYLGIRFGEKLEHKLSDTTKVWQSLEYVPKVNEWTDKYTITAEVGISAAITKQWSLRVVAQDIYDNDPAPGNENNDFRLLAGTEYKF